MKLFTGKGFRLFYPEAISIIQDFIDLSLDKLIQEI